MFVTLETVGNNVKEAMKAHAIDVRITWVSSYKVIDTCKSTPM